MVRAEGRLLFPLSDPAGERKQADGALGTAARSYLQEHRKIVYTQLLTIGRLNSYLAEIDQQAQERMEVLVEQMKQAQGITEQLKAENAMEWVGRMNNIRACAREIVNAEIIYA